MGKQIAELREVNGRKLLFVDGKPFRARSGEVHNSSSSTAEYMDLAVWPSLRPLNLNMVVLPIAWEMIEPEEDVFDFSLVDALLEQGKRENMHYTILWFGLWKNGKSTYVPGWVKKNGERYFLVRDSFGNPINTISPICDAAVQADAKAFAKLMAYLRDHDEERIVSVVQIENEMGILGSERDFSAPSDAMFYAELPEEVAAFYGRTGTWTEAFGNDACEQFSVWCYAKAIEKIAQAGKKEYPLPMYVNVWLEQHPDRPGLYPSGGPVAKCMREWLHYAPTVDFVAPDIYVSDFRKTIEEYTQNGNPLFIPEVRGSVDAIPFYLYAVAQYDAMCFAPFGIENLYTGAEVMDAALLASLNIEAGAFRQDPRTWKMLAAAYEQVAELEEMIEQAREEGRLYAFLEENDLGKIIPLKDYDLRLNYRTNAVYGGAKRLGPDEPRAGGFIIALSDDDYLMVGVDVQAEFLPKQDSKETVGYLRIEEGTYKNGAWNCLRVLNGDEGGRLNFGPFITQRKVSLYRYR